jgi:hypothetical protein
MVGRSNSITRWKEHLTSCFSRGVRDYKEGLYLTDCPYTGKGVDTQRADKWRKGFKCAEKKYGKLRTE